MKTSPRTVLVALALVAAGLVVPGGSAQAVDATLRIGALLPTSGNLKVLGPPGIAGVRLAVADINAAGGVFGRPVELEVADSGDSTTARAAQNVAKLMDNGADVIIGPSSSTVTLRVIDRVVGAGRLLITPSTTSTLLTGYPDQGLHFRTAPSDTYQGQVLAEVARGAKAKRLAVLALKDPSYGAKVSAAARKTFKAAGGKVVYATSYNYATRTFRAQVLAAKAKKPDAVAVIGFEESARVLAELRTQGLLPQAGSGPRVYLVDGSMSQSYKLATGTLSGVRGTIPGAKPRRAFADRLRAAYPKLRDYSYAVEAYDATIMAALSAISAASDSGVAMAARMREVSGGGTACRTFASCAGLLGAGQDIDYDGESGRIEFDGNGNVRWAQMGVYQYGKDNRYKPWKFLAGAVRVE